MDNLSSPKKDYICHVCSEDGIELVAVSWCIVCREALCQDCTYAHKKVRLSRNHNLTEYDSQKTCVQHQGLIKELSLSENCPEHETEMLLFFCQIHEKTCCSLCCKKHIDCVKVSKIEHLGREIRDSDSAKDLLKTMKDILDDGWRFSEIRKKSLQGLEENTAQIIEQVETLTNQLQQKVKDLKSSTLKHLDVIHLEEGNKIRDDVDIVTSENISLYKAIQTLEMTRSVGSDTQLFLATKMSNETSKHATKLLNERKCEVKEIKYTFSPSAFIADFNDETASFGDVNITSVSKRDCPRHLQQKQEVKLDQRGETPSRRLSTKRRQVEGVKTKPRIYSFDCYGKNCNNWYVTGVAIFSNGDILAADCDNGAVNMYDQTGTLMHSKIWSYAPYRVAVMYDRTVVVTDKDFGTVDILTAEAVGLHAVKSIKTYKDVHEVATVDKKCIVLCGSEHTSCLLTVGNDGVEDVLPLGDLLRSTSVFHGLGYHKSKNLYLTNRGNELIGFNRNRQVKLSYKYGRLASLRGIAVANDDNIFVAARNVQKILHFNPEGVLVKKISTAPVYPNALAISPSDNMLCIAGGYSAKIHVYQLD